jgi:hypothetical protein
MSTVGGQLALKRTGILAPDDGEEPRFRGPRIEQMFFGLPSAQHRFLHYILG